MADIQGIVSQVEGACQNYRQTTEEMSQLENNIQMMTDEANQIDNEISSIDRQAMSLQSQANAVVDRINSNSGNEGYDSSSDLAELNRIRQQLGQLSSEKQILEQQEMQNAQQLNAAKQLYAQKREYANNLKNYLEAMRTKMTDAANELQTKISNLSGAISIFSSASGNMFGRSALEQAGNLGASKEEYQANLNIAQNVIEMISSTLDDQGSSDVKVLRRR